MAAAVPENDGPALPDMPMALPVYSSCVQVPCPHREERAAVASGSCCGADVESGAVLGVGMDLVNVTAFAAHYDTPGTSFRQRVWTPREQRDVDRRVRATGSQAAEHFAARWAAKEAFIKAWSQAVNRHAGGSQPPVLPVEHVVWS